MASILPSDDGRQERHVELRTTVEQANVSHGISPEVEKSASETITHSVVRQRHSFDSQISSSYDPRISRQVTPDSTESPHDSALHTTRVPSSIESMLKTADVVKLHLGKGFATNGRDLVVEDHEIKGDAQMQPISTPKAGVNDLGWHKRPNEINSQLIGGVANGELFAMVRRFNKDVFDVRALPKKQGNELDLTEAWVDDHAGNKLTMNLQRVYLNIVLGCASFGNQMSRLRSWKESQRTASFCLLYFIAWHFDMLVPTLLGTLVLLTSSRRVRTSFFPSAPVALVNMSTGGLKEPPAGQLGTADTLTGAPERSRGEAREEEAANFINNARHLVAHAVGMHDSNSNEGDPLEGKLPGPIRRGIKSVKTAGAAPGHSTDESGQDMTQEPMEDLLWNEVQPKIIEPLVKALPHAIGEVVDTWERLHHTISPIPPFSSLAFLRLEAVLVPIFLMSLIIPQYVIYKAAGLAFGFVLFGDPIISKGLRLLNEEFPYWKQLLEPKNNILRGVPTNRQLTLTLLRIGEVHQSPIPPTATSRASDAILPTHLSTDDIPLGASNSDISRAMGPALDGQKREDDLSNDSHEKRTSKTRRLLSKLFSGFRKGAVVTIESKLSFDRVRTAAGSKSALRHVGALAKKDDIVYAGPSQFMALLNGTRGWLHIIFRDSHTPYLIFNTDEPHGAAVNVENPERTEPTWSMAVNDIRRLTRTAASASKPVEKVADWADDRELMSSIEIEDDVGKTWRFNGLPERNELFNRLVALGDQRWENM